VTTGIHDISEYDEDEDKNKRASYAECKMPDTSTFCDVAMSSFTSLIKITTLTRKTIVI
jgi:hypothetical protein